MNLQLALEEFKNEQDLVGLWQVIHTIKEADPTLSGSDLKQRCLEFVRLMLLEGFAAGTPPYAISGFSKWKEQRIDQILERIEREWNSLGHEPNIPDIVWFLPPNLNN